MRMRKKRNFDARLDKVKERLIENPCEMKGKWREIFGNENPIHIEIGSGKGKFISEMAEIHKDVNYIAVDVIPDCILMALEKTADKEYSNLKYIISDAKELINCFDKDEIDRVYLNFSDPWKKNKQAKRRLTHQNFLDVYKAFLIQGGRVCFKTDNRGLFEFSLNSISADRDFCLSNISLDLHNSSFEGNVMTEYEQKFSQMGMPIYRLEAEYLIKEQKDVNK